MEALIWLHLSSGFSQWSCGQAWKTRLWLYSFSQKGNISQNNHILVRHAVTGLKAGVWMLSSIYNTLWVSLSGFMTVTANGITQYLPAVESSSWTSSIYLQQPRRYYFLASGEWPTHSFSQIFFFLSLCCCPAKPQSKPC